MVMRLTDEPYKIRALKMYMTDYLENICTVQLRRHGIRERETIDVIAAENTARNAKAPETGTGRRKGEKAEPPAEKRAARSVRAARSGEDPEEKELPINIEGEPREQEPQEKGTGERAPLREEAIRQILEEFLA